MKIWILANKDGKIVAVTEDEQLMINYILQNNFSIEEYSYYKKKGKDAEFIAINFENEYLIHDIELDTILTIGDHRVIITRLEDEKYKIYKLIHLLEHAISNYNLSKKLKSKLLDSHSSICTLVTTRDIKKIVKLDEVIDFIAKKPTTIGEMMKEHMQRMTSHLREIIKK